MKALIKKITPCTLLIPIMAGFLINSGCTKSSNSSSNSPDQATVNLLVGSAGKVWQLRDGNYQTWTLAFDGWHEYTVGPGSYLFSNCVVNNNFIAFYADGTSMQSNYTCDTNAPTNFVFSKEKGSSGAWSLSSDNTTLNVSIGYYFQFKLISVTATDLYLGNFDGTFHFVSVNSMPFLSNTQFLSGTGTKVWKYNSSAIGANRVIQPLTAAEADTRLTFNADGTLVKSFTDVVYGQPITGTWMADAYGGSFTYTFPAVGSSAAINQSAKLWELTNTSFTYDFFDANNTYGTTINLVPQ